MVPTGSWFMAPCPALEMADPTRINNLERLVHIVVTQIRGNCSLDAKYAPNYCNDANFDLRRQCHVCTCAYA